MPKFSEYSLKNLRTCNYKLQLLFESVIEEYDCRVICGHRNKNDQNSAYYNGYSKLKWPNSNHNTIPSNAVDVVPYPIDWNDTKRFKELSEVVKRKAKELNIEVRWGGDFKTFIDMPHWELKNTGD